MKKINKASAVLLIIAMVAFVVLPTIVFPGCSKKKSSDISISRYKNLSIRGMDKYRAIGVAARNMGTGGINASTVSFSSSSVAASTGGQVIVGLPKDDEEIEEVVFQDLNGIVQKEDLHFSGGAIIYDKFTVSAGGSGHVIDHASGDIFELTVTARDGSIRFSGSRQAPFFNNAPYDWCESDTGVYFNMSGSGNVGGIYKLQNINGKAQVIEVFKMETYKKDYHLMYVDRYNNIFAWRYDYTGTSSSIKHGFFRETSKNKYKFTYLDSDPAGRQPDGKVYLTDGISYFDQNGKLQQAEKQVDITFLAQIVLGEYDGAKYIMFLYNPIINSPPMPWTQKFEVYKHTSEKTELVFSVTGLSSHGYSFSTVILGMPRVSPDTITYLELDRRIATYNFRTDVYEQSGFFPENDNFIGGFSYPKSELLVFRFLPY